MANASRRSSFRGVTWRNRHDKWQAGISLHGRYLYLGTFYNEEDAARMWDLAALKSRGKTTRTNFAVSESLDSRGKFRKPRKVNTGLQNINTKRAAAAAVEWEEAGVEEAAAGEVGMEATSACTPSEASAAAEAGVAMAVLKAPTKRGPAKRRKRVPATYEPVYVHGSSSNTGTVAVGSPCLSATRSCETPPSTAAGTAVDTDYSQDIWSQLGRGSTPPELSALDAAAAAASGTQSVSATSFQTSRATSSMLAFSCQDASAGVGDTVDAVARMQQQEQQQLYQQCSGSVMLQQYQQQQQCHQLAGCNGADGIVADFLHFTQPLQPPQLLQQQQQHSESHCCVSPYVGSPGSSAAGAALAEALLSSPDVEDLLLPPLTDLMQEQFMPVHPLTQQAHHSSGSSSSLAPINQLLLLAPGYQLVDVLSAGSAVFGAVLAAACPRSGLSQVMPWRAYVWDPAGWQQLGAYAAEGDARRACHHVLGLLTAR